MAEENGQMKHTLHSRHLTMIALGGTIGTGLFIASGSAITTAGPGGESDCLCRHGDYGLLPDDFAG